MPYTTPTTDDFYTRFPIFADVDEDSLQALLNEAAGQIDNSWREQDYQPAILYLTAHLIALDNSAEGETPDVNGPQVISSESFAGMSVSYASRGQLTGAAASQYGATEYGRRYYSLLQKNKPGVTTA